ncbi:MAG TPA: DUF6600 domain-containing protein [Verrucomicrobiae bacterium]
MKTKCLLAVVAASLGLSLLTGCEEGHAEGEIPVVAAPEPAPAPPGGEPVVAAVASEAANAPAAAPSTNLPPPKVVQTVTPPENLKLSPAVQDILKLTQAGLGEDIMLAYVTNAPKPGKITSDEILYLNDLGVPSSVISALVQHQGVDQVAPAQVPPPAPPITAPAPVAPGQPNGLPPAVAELPPNQGAAVATPPLTPPAAYEQPVDTTYFYGSLSPYGNWIDVNGYGLCWQPSVAVVNPGWRPYCDRGRWLWTDAGWYWYSDYSWGWAPFHYGRWCTYPRVGWVWVPDNCWGPSWVSWRYTSDYCGWAPLPPLAIFSVGIGFGSHHHSDWNLHPSFYTFVPAHRFLSRDLHRFAAPPHLANTVFHNSVTANNYASTHTHPVVNTGFGAEHLARVTGAPVPKIAIHETTTLPMAATHSEHFEKNGAAIVVPKPALAAPPGGRLTSQVVHNRPATVTGSVNQNSSGLSAKPPATGNPVNFSSRPQNAFTANPASAPPVRQNNNATAGQGYSPGATSRVNPSAPSGNTYSSGRYTYLPQQHSETQPTPSANPVDNSGKNSIMKNPGSSAPAANRPYVVPPWMNQNAATPGAAANKQSTLAKTDPNWARPNPAVAAPAAPPAYTAPAPPQRAPVYNAAPVPVPHNEPVHNSAPAPAYHSQPAAPVHSAPAPSVPPARSGNGRKGE